MRDKDIFGDKCFTHNPFPSQLKQIYWYQTDKDSLPSLIRTEPWETEQNIKTNFYLFYAHKN